MNVGRWVRIVLWLVAASVAASMSVGGADAAQEVPSPGPRISGTPDPLTPGRWQSLRTSQTRGTCGIASDGSGWCWGLHYPGDGSNRWSPVPTQVPGTWLDLQPGDTTCGIRTDRSGWCWGENNFGAVGNGEYGEEPVPAPHRLPGQWKSIEAPRGLRTCGIRTDDTLWCWGSNHYGILGVGSVETTFPEPQQLPGRWRSVSLKPYTTCAVRIDDTGWCWGDNGIGLVGDGSFTDRRSPTRLPGAWRTIEGRGYQGVFCGVRTDETGWCWGYNLFGNVGGRTTSYVPKPRQVPGPWRSIDSDGVTCGIRPNGTGWCWGPNGDGNVGTGSRTPRIVTKPFRLPGQWAAIEPGRYSTCGRRPDGRVFCWGGNYYGETGTGTPWRGIPSVLAPTRVRPHVFTTLSLNQETACGVRVDGTGWCWGRGRDDEGAGTGSIGDGFRYHRPWPQQVL